MQSNNFKILKLFQADQNDRKKLSLKSDFSVIRKNDLRRKEELLKIIKRSELFTAQDYLYSALIMQHGDSPEDFKKAQQLSEKAIELGSENAKWLYAAATDRYLRSVGKKQKFGTQYEQYKENSILKLAPVDKRISDSTRKKFNVEPLIKIKKTLKP